MVSPLTATASAQLLLHHSLKQEVDNGIDSGKYPSETHFLLRLVVELTLRVRELEAEKSEQKGTTA